MKQIHPILHSVLHNPLLIILTWSLLAIGTVWIRYITSGSTYYIFMIWNLLLALVPLGISGFLVMHKIKRYTPALAAVFFLWIIFYPNTLYMITDFVHLKGRNGIPLWYDFILLILFASAGLYIGFISLTHMHILVRKLFSEREGWIFSYITLFLSGFGVYFGRFLRWNSWDIFFNPLKILRMNSFWIANPFHYPKIIVISLLFAAFFIAFYRLMIAAHDSFFRRKY